MTTLGLGIQTLSAFCAKSGILDKMTLLLRILPQNVGRTSPHLVQGGDEGDSLLPWRSREAPLPPPRPRLAPWFLALGCEVGASWRIQHHFQLLPSSQEGFGPCWMSPERNFATDLVRHPASPRFCPKTAPNQPRQQQEAAAPRFFPLLPAPPRSGAPPALPRSHRAPPFAPSRSPGGSEVRTARPGGVRRGFRGGFCSCGR